MDAQRLRPILDRACEQIAHSLIRGGLPRGLNGSGIPAGKGHDNGATFSVFAAAGPAAPFRALKVDQEPRRKDQMEGHGHNSRAPVPLPFLIQAAGSGVR